MEKKSYKLLSIFAHQDDETFSAGGTLAKYGDAAHAVCVTFDPLRKEEFENACRLLGISGQSLGFEEITPAQTSSITNKLVAIIREVKPEIIITHVDFDYHAEHRLLHQIVKEAIEWASHTTSSQNAHQVRQLWAAETTVLIPFPHIYIDISKQNLNRQSAIACYESQSDKGGNGFYSKFHTKRTELRGIQAGVDHAEAFLSIPIAIAGSFKPQKVYQEFPT